MKYLITLTFFLLPVLVLAAPSYIPLVGIPNVGTGADFTFDKFINALYALSISIAALLAVIKIVIAGVKYMLTDIVTSKGEAKKDIYGALLGLLVVLGAVLILTIINPKLVKDVNVTFLEIGQATIPNSSVAGTLNTSIISRGDLGNGAYVEFFPRGQGSEQEELFRKSCLPPSTLGNTPGGLQCLHHVPGVNIITTQIIPNVTQKEGVTCAADPIVTNVGYCGHIVR